MKKTSFQNAEHEELPVLRKVIQVNKDSSTESAGRNGVSLQELLMDPNGINPEDYESEMVDSEKFEISPDLLSLLLNLGNELDASNEISEADFTDFLLKKFSSIDIDYVKKFNDLLVKILSAKLVNNNEIVKSLAKRFSKIILAELDRGKDKEEAEAIAYNRMVLKIKRILGEV